MNLAPARGEITVRTRVKDKADVAAQGKAITQLLTPALPGITAAAEPEYNAVQPEHLKQIQNILATRVNETGVAEPVIQAMPEQKRVLVEIPGTHDPKRIEDLIGQTADLQFRAIPKKYGFLQSHGPIPDGKGGYTFTDSTDPKEKPVSADTVLAVSAPILTGKDLKENSSRVISQAGQETEVYFEFKGAARDTLTEFTRRPRELLPGDRAGQQALHGPDHRIGVEGRRSDPGRF